MDKHFTSYTIDDRSYVAFVKREIHNDLIQSRFSKKRIAECDIILAELTSNLIKHAGGGELLSRLATLDSGGSVLEIVTIDEGPGIPDIPKMMKDGTSTKSTLGHGLGAIQRMSNFFQIFSMPKWGTISYCVVYSEDAKPLSANGFESKCLVVPKPKEVFCGDGFLVKKTKEDIRIFFGDGLGHGPHASDAVSRAKEFFYNCHETNPVDILRQMHDEVRKTRGLVASIAILDLKTKKWKFCGIGNILTRLYGGMMFKHYMSYNGIVGLNIPGSLNFSTMDVERNQQLIMCSDGIRTRWDLTKYSQISKYDPMILAAALYKDFNRRNDDSSIFIGKVHVNI